MTQTHWYVVKTKVRAEQVAEDNLRRQGYEVWSPRIIFERRRRGRWQLSHEPLFPGYLFVQLEAGRQSFSPIRSTRGVSSLVSFAREPKHMPPGAMESLRQLHERNEHGPASAPFESGQKVRLVGGAFAGWEGMYHTRSGQERVVVMLQVLGKEQALVFARDDVVPA